MRYSETLHFEPIETVIQLREASTESAAKQLVRTFVISRRLQEQLLNVVFPQLQFSNPYDNKGVLIVGNYGTGKSHLMSVITSLAEYPDIYSELSDHQVANKARELISAMYKVIRIEIGATTQSFRDIICNEVERYLSKIGVIYHFPKLSEITNNKESFVEMMSAFHEKYPDHGLILAVDELLDYLRGRDDQDLILDLNFMREIGEVCRLTRFRFIAGLQESLFENPRFQFQTETIRRVKDRFEQIRISREDIAYVVSERLLRKDEEQKHRIGNHLDKFLKLYENLAERRDEFVKLFPVHPAYLETLEHVYIAEKREVLKTISFEMRKMFDREIPSDEPGLLTYDSYWQSLKENPSFRTDPDVREVISASKILEDKVQQSMAKKQYKPIAIRIIHALSVHRLTTGDIYNQIGSTSEEMRDNLCLFMQLPEMDAAFLKDTIDSILREIMKTVSGSYISLNTENSQYYLDLKKTVDYDSLIQQRGYSLDENKLDRYYFEALTRVMEYTDTTYISGFKIWEHELEWISHKVTRMGYLFFGAPNERSTAQPPRDFYIYFLRLFDPPKFKDEKKPDEVIFRISDPGMDFVDAIRLYGGAREMSSSASSGNRQIYEDKAGIQLLIITKWLKEKFNTVFQITYKGVTKQMFEWSKRGSITGASTNSFRANIDEIASICLSSHFEELSPEYPKFSIPVTEGNRREYVSEALRWIKGSHKTRQGAAILEGLELLEGDQLHPNRSKFAKYILRLVEKKGEGQVVNRNEVLEEIRGIEFEKKFRLEPEWVIVVLGALVYSGDIILSYPNRKIDASSFEELIKIPMDQAINFKHIERPKEFPVGTLVDLFALLDIQSGLIRNPENRDAAVKQLQLKISDLLNQILSVKKNIQTTISGFDFKPVADTRIVEYDNILNNFKGFLENLQPYNTPGKLKNFRFTRDQIGQQKMGIESIKTLQAINDLLQEISPLLYYLSAGESMMQRNHPYIIHLREQRSKIITHLQNENIYTDITSRMKILRDLKALKDCYIEEYLKLHSKARLNSKGMTVKSELKQSPKLARLSKLVDVEILPRRQLDDFQVSYASLKSCLDLTPTDLKVSSYLCPHCNFRPIEESVSGDVNMLIYDYDDKLEVIEKQWTHTLIQNLTETNVKKNFSLLNDKQEKLLNNFIQNKELPENIEDDFVETIKEVLSGLEKLEIKIEDLKNAMTDSGTPCKPEEFKDRFDKYLATKMKGKDPEKIRIILS
jgi:hypothetical protein